MKRVALLAAVALITAGLSFYIADYRLPGDNHIGYQEDVAEDMASGFDEVVFTDPTAQSDTTPQATAPAVRWAQAANLPPLEPSAEESSAQEDWQLVWADEFDSPELSMEYWTEMDRLDNYNEELQYYSPANSFIEDGRLILEARLEDKDGKHYSSGMVQTMNKLDVLFGRIEARMSLPVGKGFFPAFWMLTEDDSYEIDIQEMIGSEPTLVYGRNHYPKGKTLAKNWGMTTVDDPGAFHIYAVEWDKASIRWYVDDKIYFSTEIGVPDEKMYMILTLAVGVACRAKSKILTCKTQKSAANLPFYSKSTTLFPFNSVKMLDV